MEGPGHEYGPRVRVSDSPYLASLLARIGSPETELSLVLELLRAAYRCLAAEALVGLLPTVEATVPTRMAALHGPRGAWSGRVLDPAASVVVVDVIRGGIVPAQVTFELLAQVLPSPAPRLDHLNMARVADDTGRVARVDLTGSKVGGSVEGATLIVPDPMGATGSTLVEAYRHYLEHHGRPARVLALPLMATPEFLRRVLDEVPEAVVHAGRIDRGLSPPEVLAAPPGRHWAQERGLDDNDYIVPGAGGVGEVLNNSWC